MALTKQQIDDLEATHKRVAVLRGKPEPGNAGPSFEIVLRRPTRMEYKQFRAMAHDPVKKPEAQEQLAIKCCVYPASREDFSAILDDWPGIPEAASKAIVALTGMEAEDELK